MDFLNQVLFQSTFGLLKYPVASTNKLNEKKNTYFAVFFIKSPNENGIFDDIQSLSKTELKHFSNSFRFKYQKNSNRKKNLIGILKNC